MTDDLTPSESALCHIYAELGVPAGVAIQETILNAHWGRGDGLTSSGELKSAIFSLQARGWLQPGDELFGNLGWELTEDGVVGVSDHCN